MIRTSLRQDQSLHTHAERIPLQIWDTTFVEHCDSSVAASELLINTQAPMHLLYFVLTYSALQIKITNKMGTHIFFLTQTASCFVFCFVLCIVSSRPILDQMFGLEGEHPIAAPSDRDVSNTRSWVRLCLSCLSHRKPPHHSRPRTSDESSCE